MSEEAYIPKRPNELIRAADWNEIQIAGRRALAKHDHSGGEDQGAPIGAAGLAPAAVTAEKLAATAVTTEKLAATAVTTDKLAATAVTTDKLAATAVTTDKLARGAVTADKLGSGAVIEVKLADAAVSTAKLADAGVTTPKLADAGVTTPKLADAGVTEPKLGSAAVSTAKLADASVTAPKLGNAAVTTPKLADAGVTTPKLADASVTTPKLADASVTTSKIVDGAITQAKLDPNIELARPLRLLTAVGGDGQLGRPGETLEIALRVRVSDGERPIVGARVRFELLGTKVEGTALNQLTGGCLHASTNRVAATKWPGGSLDQQVVVSTDADGVAQVQHVLGTSAQLPVKRVQAILLDPNNAETSQRVLFTAHLLLGTEVGCYVGPTLTPFMTPGSDPNIQAALDGVTNALRKLGALALAARPLTLEQVPITPGMSLPRAGFTGVRVRGVQATNLDALPLCVWAEVPQVRGSQGANAEELEHVVEVYSVVRLEGSLTQESGDLVWRIAPAARSWLLSKFTALESAPPRLRLVVELVPWALGLEGSPQRWPVWLV